MSVIAVPVEKEQSPSMSMTRQKEDLEALEVRLLLEAVYQYYGYDFRDYAFSPMKSRVWDRVRAEGVATITALQERLLHDSRVMERFLFAISLEESAMFNDPEFYQALRLKVIPMLRESYFVRIWHVGCSTGEEVYSLAILLEEEGLHDRYRIYCTDINETVLRKARQGIFPLAAMEKHADKYMAAGGTASLAQYYSQTYDNAIMQSPLRKSIVFAQHNLVTDSSFNEFHLVVCRNVLCHFNGNLRTRVMKLLDDSLAPQGVLALGNRDTSRPTSSSGAKYQEIDKKAKLYRKDQ